MLSLVRCITLGLMAELQIHDGHASIAETVPADLTFMDEYQATVHSMVVFDDGHATIRGKNPVRYHHDGILEEIDEITGGDMIETGYFRLGALVSLQDTALIAQAESPTAIARHLKEFGDVSWYLANFLQWFGIDFSFVVEPGLQARTLDTISNPRSTPEGYEQAERLVCWPMFLASLGRLASATKGMMRDVGGHLIQKHREDRLKDEQELVIASGLFVISAMHTLRNRFDVDYEYVLQQNVAKINQRISEGTVFDKRGGDDR